MNEYRILRSTGTHADVFAAAGLAALLEKQLGWTCRLIEASGQFAIRCASGNAAEAFGSWQPEPGFRYLALPKKPKPDHVHPNDIIDASEQQERAARAREIRQQISDARKRGAREAIRDLQAQLEEAGPHPDWPLYRTLRVLKAADCTNGFFASFAKRSDDERRMILTQALAALENGAALPKFFKPKLVQLFTPLGAKGYARLKPDSTDRNEKTKDSWAEPFLEWLRFQGYFSVACPYTTGNKGENVRLLCPVPENISYEKLHEVIVELRKVPIWGSAPKIDCLATLSLAELLVQRSGGPDADEEWAVPAALISGITIVQYQSMGQAHAISSMEQLAIPGWMELQGERDRTLWLAILEEHRGRLRWLDDKVSEELGLLQQYRRFLQSRGPAALIQFLIFLEQYGIFLLRMSARNKPYAAFSAANLEALLKQNNSFREILENSGFRAIAGALRSSTVSAQSRKRNKLDYREIRYDILPELKRKRVLPDKRDFMDALAEFVTEHNLESARRHEQGKPTGIRRVSVEEFQSFVDLMDGEKNAELVGAMLCAFATCTAGRGKPANGNGEPDETAEEFIAPEEETEDESESEH